MTPFEAYILIQQSSPSNSNSFTSLRTENSALEEALKSQRLNPNGAFKRESFLSTAIKRNSPQILRLFLEYGASPDLKSYENGRYEPSIVTAVRYKSMTCVEILLEYGANMHKTNFYGSDAIFQAVHENAFNILEYLLVECHQSQNGSDVQSQKTNERPEGNPIVIQKVTREEVGTIKTSNTSTIIPVLNIKESSYYIENDCDHLLCPFYYALNNATVYPSKAQSLVRLLQFYYKCKCVRPIASCCRDCDGKEDKVAVVECLEALDSFLQEVFYEKSQSRVFPVAAASSIDRDLEKQHDHYNSPNAIFTGCVDDDYENYMKSERGENVEKLCAYKILRIEEKCHAIKENEASSSSSPSSSSSSFPTGSGRTSSFSPTTAASYLVLVGPLTLSCMAREVIRNQIMPLCTCTRSRNSIFASSSGITSSSPSAAIAIPPAVYNHYGGKKNLEMKRGQKCEKGNFRKCLETLKLPASLLDYIQYGNIRRKLSNTTSVKRGTNNIKLIKKDLMLNVNYFAFYIF